ncbi:MAG: hypothetical protein D6761_02745 [Candidatus Dadabacteria bacterium]|nr:MAG: hypothetical protein D6761_02745 [Candidatus Dadabacteria bacterium]
MPAFEHPLLIWLVCLPLAGWLLAWVAQPVSRRLAGLAATGAAGATLGLALRIGYEMQMLIPDKRHLVQSAGSWMRIGDVYLAAELLFDPLAMIAVVWVAGVCLLFGLASLLLGRPRMGASAAAALFFVTTALLSRHLAVFAACWSLGAFVQAWWLRSEDALRQATVRGLWLLNLLADVCMIGAVVVAARIAGTADVYALVGQIFRYEAMIPLRAIEALAGLLLAAAFIRTVLVSAALVLRADAPRSLAAVAGVVVTAVPAVFLLIRLAPVFRLTPELLHDIQIWVAVGALVAVSPLISARRLVPAPAGAALAAVAFSLATVANGGFAAAIPGLLAALTGALLLGACTDLTIRRVRAAGADADADLAEALGGLGDRMPGTFLLATAATALAGMLPPFGPFGTGTAMAWHWLASPLRAPGAALLLLACWFAMATGLTSLWLNTWFGVWRGRPEVRGRLSGESVAGLLPLFLMAVALMGGAWFALPAQGHWLGLGWIDAWIMPVTGGSRVALADEVGLVGIWMGVRGLHLWLGAALIVAGALTWLLFEMGQLQRIGALPGIRGIRAAADRQWLIPDLCAIALSRTGFAVALMVVAGADAISRLAAAVARIPGVMVVRRGDGR